MSKRRKICHDGSKQVVLESQNTSSIEGNEHRQARNVLETASRKTNCDNVHSVKPVPETLSLNASSVNKSIVQQVPETQSEDLAHGDVTTTGEVPETQDMDKSHYSAVDVPGLDKKDTVSEARQLKIVSETQSMDTSHAIGNACPVAETQEIESFNSESVQDESRSLENNISQFDSANEKGLSLSHKGEISSSVFDKGHEGKIPTRNISKVPIKNNREEKLSPKSDFSGGVTSMGTKDFVKESNVDDENTAEESVKKRKQTSESVMHDGEAAFLPKREPRDDFQVLPDGFLNSRLPRQVFKNAFHRKRDQPSQFS